jgi:rhodanese-related sulfurtransferase
MRIPAVRPAEVSDGAHLIDVREDDEWLAGHAPDAVHLPMMELPGRLDEVPREGDVVIVCRAGHRSEQVVRYLMAQGYDNVRNMIDGMLGWAVAGRPVVAPDGSPGVVD